MHHPLCIHPDKSITLLPALFGSAGRFAVIASVGKAIVCNAARYNKRNKETHRFAIADVNGPLMLTIPVSHDISSLSRPLTWNDITLSRHGAWWYSHLGTLESAYGRTPFFEFYVDRLRPFFAPDTTDRYPTLPLYCEAAEKTICAILGIPAPEYTDIPAGDTPLTTYPALSPYYQVRAATLGFIPSLSILDLIFNLGPEAPLALRPGRETH